MEIDEQNWGGAEVENAFGIAPDYRNVWIAVHGIVRDSRSTKEEERPWAAEELQLLEPISLYEDYLRKQESLDPKRKGYADRVLGASNPVKVAELDALAREFNALLPKIKETADYKALAVFWNRAADVFTGEKFEV